jgi:hypothetical protein
MEVTMADTSAEIAASRTDIMVGVGITVKKILAGAGVEAD